MAADLILRPYQEEIIGRIQAAWSSGNRRVVCWLPTGGGKCLGKGTPVLLYDGRVIPVEDVKAGDLLMGPDSTPRKVSGICRGREMLYRVTPTKGDPYVVNESHILSLRMTMTGEVVNLPVTEYLSRSATFRHCAKGWRTGVEFEAVPVDQELPPYILGLWLGDGSHNKPDITTADAEVACEWVRYAKAAGCDVRVDAGRNCLTLTAHKGRTGGVVKNPVISALRRVGVLFEKHVPHAYKANSREVRLDLLAGILDTDGYLHHGHFDITLKQRQLAYDVAFIARSLGLAAYVSETTKAIRQTGFCGTYYRVSISGDIDMIPCRVKRRQAEKRRQKKNVLNTGITVEPIGVGDYFGFSLDGDRLFLLGDFTVTHNTELACKLAQLEMQAGGHTLFCVERKSLCAQGANRFRKYGMLTGILRANDTFVRGYEPVTVGSVQTLRARHETDVVRGVLDRTTLLIVDEAHILHRHHHELLRYLPDARVVGLTATPLRDGLGLRYDTLIRGPSYEWMIDQGFLVRPRYFMPASNRLQTALDGVAVKSTGDYQDDELSRVMRDKSLIGDIVSTWKTKAENRRTLVFCVDIAHSKDVCDEFNADGVSAEHLDYMTKDEDRLKIFERFRSGETRVLCSVVALSIGFDEPAASCVVLARPTLSLSLHIQQIGRGLRPFAGKSDCLIFDHALNVVRHDKIESFDPPELSKLDKRSDCRRRSDPVCDYRPCPECSAILSPKQRECHECGHVIKSVHTVDWQDGDLVEGGAAVIPLHENRDFYRQLLWIAKQRGYKPGWPYFAYIERYPNRKPPYSWRDLKPIPPTAETLRYLKSRQIARRKAQGGTA